MTVVDLAQCMKNIEQQVEKEMLVLPTCTCKARSPMAYCKNSDLKRVNFFKIPLYKKGIVSDEVGP
jgi:hypothetical protein